MLLYGATARILVPTFFICGVKHCCGKDYFLNQIFKNMTSFSLSTKARLEGKTAVITGANTGIGKITARDFYVRGARVILACRNLERANMAALDIEESCKYLQGLGTVTVETLDLASLKSVRECARRLLDKEQRIDLLVNNAGVMMCPEARTEDGFEMQMGTNHLGHFLFTLLLLPTICKSTPARIVNVSSVLHTVGGRIDLEDLNWNKKRYRRLSAYQQSKLANILFTKELARRLEESGISGVTTYSLHPGVINTELLRHLEQLLWPARWCVRGIVKRFFKTAEQGAQTTIHCAVEERCSNQTGLYYSDRRVKSPSSAALNEEDARGLWELSSKLVGLEEGYKVHKF